MSAHQHLDDNALFDRLYGLADETADLESCPACLGRWRSLQEKRTMLAGPMPVSADFLAGQRRKIYERLERPDRIHLGWVPAFAAACLLAVVFLIHRPQEIVRPAAGISDAQLYNDVYSMEQSLEPSAAAPIHALFEGEAAADDLAQSEDAK